MADATPQHKSDERNRAAALRHIDEAIRRACAPNWLKAIPEPLDHIAIIGDGAAGIRTALALLKLGSRVTLVQPDRDGVISDHGPVDTSSEVESKLQRMAADSDDDWIARLTITQEYGAAREAGLVIEATPEDYRDVNAFTEHLNTVLKPGAFLALNSASMSIADLAARIDDPSRVLRIHLPNCAHDAEILEIVRSDRTDARALAMGFVLAKQMGCVPVFTGAGEGLIGDRILARYHEAADTVFLDGSTPWDIDEAMVEFGFAMGPYEEQDLSGLDHAHSSRKRIDASRSITRRHIPISDRMMELGKLGKKVGAGWYRYPGGGGKVDDPIVADLALEEAHFAGITRCEFSHSEIRSRLLLAMINEAADIMYEGVAACASDIDLVTVLGYGFPKWRGGLLHYADSIGLERIVDQLHSLAEEDPVAWNPSPALTYCVEHDQRIAEFQLPSHDFQ